MFIAHIVRTDKETKAEARSAKRFTEHKSARSYARRNIVNGAHFVAILEREKADDESNEVKAEDVTRNIYRPKIDEGGVRRHLLISVEDFEAFTKKGGKSKKA
jgi:hypothetical protein